jgi:hypothetical protein
MLPTKNATSGSNANAAREPLAAEFSIVTIGLTAGGRIQICDPLPKKLSSISLETFTLTKRSASPWLNERSAASGESGTCSVGFVGVSQCRAASVLENPSMMGPRTALTIFRLLGLESQTLHRLTWCCDF